MIRRKARISTDKAELFGKRSEAQDMAIARGRTVKPIKRKKPSIEPMIETPNDDNQRFLDDLAPDPMPF